MRTQSLRRDLAVYMEFSEPNEMVAFAKTH